MFRYHAISVPSTVRIGRLCTDQYRFRYANARLGEAQEAVEEGAQLVEHDLLLGGVGTASGEP